MDTLLEKLKRRRNNGGAKSTLQQASVLLPLYIYPLNAESWQPLHAAITQNPDLNFVVIINPHNGPGAGSLPDENYSQEIPKLNAHPNVQTVGYVRTDYCRRDMSSVCEDITKFAGWSQATTQIKDSTTDEGTASSGRNSNLAMHGIFFDETPNLYTASVSVYLNSITRYVKNTQGLLGQRLVIHNPGTVPDTSLANPGPDVTAIVEGSYELYRLPSTSERITSLLRYEWDRCCYIVHSVPPEHIKSLVLELRSKAKYIFVTTVSEGAYTQFGPSWDAFIEAMAMM